MCMYLYIHIYISIYLYIYISIYLYIYISIYVSGNAGKGGSLGHVTRSARSCARDRHQLFWPCAWCAQKPSPAAARARARAIFLRLLVVLVYPIAALGAGGGGARGVATDAAATQGNKSDLVLTALITKILKGAIALTLGSGIITPSSIEGSVRRTAEQLETRGSYNLILRRGEGDFPRLAQVISRKRFIVDFALEGFVIEMEATGFSPIQQIESSGSKQDDSTETLATDREGLGHNPALCVVHGSASAPSHATWGLTDAGGAGTGTHTDVDGDASGVAFAVNSSDPQTVHSSSQEGVASGDASTIDYSMQGRSTQGRMHGSTSVHGSSSSEDELLRVRRSSFEIQMALNEAEQRRLRALAEVNALQEQEIRDRRAKKASREGSERSRASRPEVRSGAAPSTRGGSVASGDAHRTTRAPYPRVAPVGASPFSPPYIRKGYSHPVFPRTLARP